jgi:dienelactone hydrolase
MGKTTVLTAFTTSAFFLAACTAAGQQIAAPPSALMDEALDIRVAGLRPAQRVTLRTAMKDSAGRTWSAHAIFAADDLGRVSPARDASLGGSYTGVDAMGLITSMDLSDQPGTATYAPPSLNGISTTLVVVGGNGIIDSITIVRRFLSPGARETRLHEKGGPIGTLYLPPRVGRVPAVLVLGGSEGGNSAAQVAAQLASRGYAALSLAYFGLEGLPAALDQIPLEYFTHAITYLAALPEVDSTAIAILGSSKGAEAALLVAAHDARVRAVVAYSPSSVAWSCICPASEHSSWLLGGRSVPAIPPGRDPSFTQAPGEPLRPAVHYRYRMRDPDTVAKAIIRVEQIRGPMMLVAGDADDLWPSGEMARQVKARRAVSGADRRDVTLIYPEAGHRIAKAYLPAGSTRIAGGRMETGGTPRANSAAQADAWPRVLQFLSALFSERKLLTRSVEIPDSRSTSSLTTVVEPNSGEPQ